MSKSYSYTKVSEMTGTLRVAPAPSSLGKIWAKAKMNLMIRDYLLP
jgi:hypothetical protein